jgi:DNA modification methylase
MSAVFGIGEDSRQLLRSHFNSKLCVDPALTRQMVSYQANRCVPGLRWLKYREGFSTSLLNHLYSRAGWDGSQTILDPFSGIGTTALTASILGEGVGIELMPIGIAATRAIATSTSLTAKSIRSLRARTVASFNAVPDPNFAFRHVPITEGAFSQRTEQHLAAIRKFAASLPGCEADLVNFVAMSVLEDVSFTRKDGQYLRWDSRSGRSSAKLDKGPIPSFETRIAERFQELEEDVPAIKTKFRPAQVKLVEGSCLEKLATLPDSYFDGVITSPPYANRYDYTRTYALELAYCNYSKEDFKNLRQNLLSSTVENRSKKEWLKSVSKTERDIRDLQSVIDGTEGSPVLCEILASLRFAAKRGDLPNANVIGLVENYFLEMAVVIFQLYRVLKPGGTVFMVNDNVQYSGEEVPVDLLLSQIAEQRGFVVDRIWVLPKGKGNASQQMGKYGRREIRKCVYQWRKA